MAFRISNDTILRRSQFEETLRIAKATGCRVGLKTKELETLLNLITPPALSAHEERYHKWENNEDVVPCDL